MPLVRWPRRCPRAAALIFFAAAAALAAFGARAESDPPTPLPPRPPSAPLPPGVQRQVPPEFPAAALAAISKNWNVARAEERAKLPGAAGQMDLFWELLALLEKDEKGEKARKDKDLEAVLEWLLFGAGLYQNMDLREPVYVKVPAFSPRLGARVLDERLAIWIAQSSARQSGTEPWVWAEFPAMDKKELAAAVKRLIEKGPKHNPVTRLWMAAALLASEDAEGAKAFKDAAEALEKSLPAQAGEITSQAVMGMANAGVKAALAPLLDLAEKDAAAFAAAKTDEERSLEYRRFRGRDALSSFTGLMGWSASADAKQDAKAQVDAARAWLAANAATLAWDPQRRRFRSDAAPPGQEALYKYAVAVERKYGVKILEGANARRQTEVLGQLTALMESKAEAAGDKDVEELYLKLLEPQAKSASHGDLCILVFQRAPKANANLGARIWAMVLREALSNVDVRNNSIDPVCSTLDRVFKSLPEADSAIRTQGCALLQPDLRKAYEEARKGKDEARFTDAAFAYLHAGGTLTIEEMKELVDRVPLSWTANRYENKLLKNLDRLQETGRPIVLRLQLLAAAKEVADKRGTYYAAFRFASATGFSTAGGSPQPSPELAAQFTQWFEKHEKELHWDPNRKRFVGAPLEDDSPLLHVADAFCGRYKVEFATPVNNFNWYREVIEELIKLSAKNKEAAKDPLFLRLLFGVASTGKTFLDTNYAKRLLVTLPAENRELGLACWVHYLDSQLAYAIKDPGSSALYTLNHLDESLQGHDRKLAAEARAKLGPAYKEKYESCAKDKLNERVSLMLACLYLDQDPVAMGLDKLGENIRDDRGAQFAYLNMGADQLAKGGCVGALRAFLVVSKYCPSLSGSGLGMFDRHLFADEGRVVTWRRRGEEPDVESRLKWLGEHAKEITWDPISRHFVVPAAAGRPGPAAPADAGQPDAGPRPVEPPKPGDNDGF